MAALEEAERQDAQETAPEMTDNAPPKSFAEVAADVIGSIKEGLPTDLSTNKKYMEGFGRD